MTSLRISRNTERPAYLGTLDARSYRAKDPRSLQLRFHTQTAGVSLTAEQPEVNLVRVAIEALEGIWGERRAFTPTHRRGVGPSHRGRRTPRASRPAGHRPRDGGSPRRRPPGWFVVHRGPNRRDGASRPRRSSPTSKAAGSGSMLEGAYEPALKTAGSSPRSPRPRIAFQSTLAKGDWIQVGVNGYVEGDDGRPAHALHRPRRRDPAVGIGYALVKQSRAQRGRASEALARLTTEAGEPDRSI